MNKQLFMEVDGVNYALTYALLENELVVEGAFYKSYGVKIDKYDENGACIQTASVCNLTANHSKAKRFLEQLVCGRVTPYTLKDLAEDCII